MQVFEASPEFKPIFNYGDGNITEDKCRSQYPLPFQDTEQENHDSRGVLYTQLHLQARQIVQDVCGLQGFHTRDMVALRSTQGCQQQAAHTDFDAESSDLVLDQNLPYGLIFSIGPGPSHFVVWPGSFRVFTDRSQIPTNGFPTYEPKVVQLNPGDALIFRGDLVHSGAAADHLNFRVHVYVDVDGVEREPDGTWPVKLNNRIRKFIKV